MKLRKKKKEKVLQVGKYKNISISGVLASE